MTSLPLSETFLTPDPISNPTIPLGLSRVPIAPISLWPIGTVPSALVFPHALDEDRLRFAISRVAALWPTICGRYDRVQQGDDGNKEWEYFINLSQSPIPFTVQTLERSQATEDTHVVQPNLSDYVPSLGLKYFIPGADFPLVSFRLTHLINPTSPSTYTSVLGIAWAHILGDASSAHRFIHHLSFFYSPALSPPPSSNLEPYDYPTFFPHAILPLPPPANVLQEFEIDQLREYDLPVAFGRYTDSGKESEVVVWHLNPLDLCAMRSDAEGRNKDEVREQELSGIAEKLGGDPKPGRLSDQDVISGWWVTVLQRAGVDVARLIYTINYRTLHPSHPDFPPNLPTLAANVAQMRSITLPPSLSRPDPLDASDAASALSRLVRQELEGLRASPEVTKQWLSNAAYRLKAAADKGKMQCLVPPADELLVNSNLRYDWAIPFGGDKPRYHTTTSLVRFLRVFQTNGAGAGPNAPYGAITQASKFPELIFRVPLGQTAVYEEILARDRARWATTRVPMPPLQ